jgi:hypothetical protein
MCAAMAAGKPVEVDSLPTIADGLAVKEVTYLNSIITFYIYSFSYPISFVLYVF